jgi:hypothetical protein
LGTTSFSEILGLPTTSFEIKAYPNLVELVKAFVKTKGVTAILIGA